MYMNVNVNLYQRQTYAQRCKRIADESDNSVKSLCWNRCRHKVKRGLWAARWVVCGSCTVW